MKTLALPWNGGAAVITLRAVQKYLAHRLLIVSESIVNAHFDAVDGGMNDEKKRQAIDLSLQAIQGEMEFFGLRLTLMSISDLRKKIGQLGMDEVRQQISIIEGRFLDEMSGVFLLWLPAKNRDLYQNEACFGDEFKTNFPAANQEVMEAGTCLATGRTTACVFHLMRATESGLETLHASIGLPPIAKKTWNWGNVLDQIRDRISANDKIVPKDAAWAKKENFVKSAHGFLAGIRGPLRNETMHLERSYSEADAERIWGAVKSFLGHLATELKE